MRRKFTFPHIKALISENKYLTNIKQQVAYHLHAYQHDKH